jgi:hypothetical protein
MFGEGALEHATNPASIVRATRRCESSGNVIRRARVLTCREVVTEDSIRRVQHCERRPTHRVTISQVAADESSSARCTLGAGHDDHVRIKGAHELDAHQLETETTLRKRFNGLHRSLCTESKIADRARLSFAAADESFTIVLELDLNGAATRGGAREREGPEP